MQLTDLQCGESARIIRVRLTGPLGDRLREMGLTPGARATIVRRAPLGDPIELAVRGAHIALRGSDAAQIDVESRDRT